MHTSRIQMHFCSWFPDNTLVQECVEIVNHFHCKDFVDTNRRGPREAHGLIIGFLLIICNFLNILGNTLYWAECCLKKSKMVMWSRRNASLLIKNTIYLMTSLTYFFMYKSVNHVSNSIYLALSRRVIIPLLEQVLKLASSATLHLQKTSPSREKIFPQGSWFLCSDTLKLERLSVC